MEGFVCNRVVKPIAEWVREENTKQCPPCLVKPLASSYLGALNAAGPEAAPQVAKLNEAWDTADMLTIAKALDTIKLEVGENLKKELVELDCFAQSYEPLAEEQQQQQIE